MKGKSIAVIFFVLCLCFLPDSVYAKKSKVSASWEGGDAISTGGGNGRITLESGISKTAILKVQCSDKKGYHLVFSASNALTNSSSQLLLDGVGGADNKEIAYSAAMNVDAFRTTSTITLEFLRLKVNLPSLRVRFRGASNPLPKGSLYHDVKLILTLDNYNPAEKFYGEYSDVITATVSVN